MAETSEETPSKKDEGIKISRRSAWYLGVILLIFAVGIGVVVSNTNKSLLPTVPEAAAKPATTVRPTTPTVAPTPTPDGIIKVYIVGEIQKPGVYRMELGERIDDLVKKAGGFTAYADQIRVDQALRVRDEMRVEIPRMPMAAMPIATVGAGTPEPPAAIPTPADSRLNVNTATAAQLDELPGIGATISKNIVDYRTKNGPFRSLEDLAKVPSLNKSTLEKIKDLIYFG